MGRRTRMLLAALPFALVAAGASVWWVDADHDGAWRLVRAPIDCDDGNPDVHPGAGDIPRNGIDEDCDGRDSTTKDNVVLFVIDTLRASNLGVYGYSRDTSPHMDSIGRSGAVFTNAYAPAPWTIPSLATLFTSRHPSDHGTLHPNSRLDGTIETLAGAFHDAGYTTGAFVHSAYPVLTMGFERGFDHVAVRLPGNTKRIQEWIEANRDRPFFLWLHYADPHVPYIMDKKFDGLFVDAKVSDELPAAQYWNTRECQQHYDSDTDGTMARTRMAFYDANVRQADAHVGEILEQLQRLGLTDHTLVTLTADHGEEFFEHRGCDHGQSLYDEVLHVPLMFALPGFVSPGTVVTEQVRLMDVAPTILDLVGLRDRAPAFAGRSLVDFLRGRGTDLPVVSGFLQSTDGVVALRQDGFKYIYSPYPTALRAQPQTGEELYDLRTDPEERHNLAPEGHPRLEEFRALAKRWLETHERGASAPQVDFAPQTVEHLRALGYTVDD